MCVKQFSVQRFQKQTVFALDANLCGMPRGSSFAFLCSSSVLRTNVGVVAHSKEKQELFCELVPGQPGLHERNPISKEEKERNGFWG